MIGRASKGLTRVDSSTSSLASSSTSGVMRMGGSEKRGTMMTMIPPA